ncbi:MAG: acyl-CoA thioesterase [Myxococcales bacterium]|nr:MAG: acyl-CoA thioesterase [Myxococcales bacterium]
MTQLVLPTFANNLGNIFGGQVLSWIDMCAAISAYRHARSAVVTASIDAVDFLLPIKVGHIVILKSQINAVFRTSMECGVAIWSEDPNTGEYLKAMKAYTTYVSLDVAGKPQPVQPLVLMSDEDKRRASDARARRQKRIG